jgi:hypothetical protein
MIAAGILPRVHVRFCDEFDGGFGWIAPEPRLLQRASHALVSEGGVWLVDAVDGDGVVDRVLAAGEPRGVVQLLGRHARDCAALAGRLGVGHHVLPRDPVAGAPFEPVALGREVALWWPAERTLVVADALGTAPYFRARSERVGVHPFRRLTPPRALARLRPRRLLVGHGEGILEDAATVLEDSLAHARRRTPAWWWSAVRSGRP